MRKVLLYPLSVIAIGVVILWVYVTYLLQGSLPVLDANFKMSGLSALARVESDVFGIPRIYAQNKEDAFRLLGFVTARDRLFQMDLLRRKTAGRLAEVMGANLLDSDRWHRAMGFNRVAPAIFTSLPEDQRKVLHAYADGVNQAIAQFKVLPFEFLLLDFTPDPWRVEDSLLTVLEMFTERGEMERMTTVMRAALPRKVVDFLLPKTDFYTAQLLHSGESDPIDAPLPVEDLISVLQHKTATSQDAHLIKNEVLRKGSNSWLVAPSKSSSNRAILANDMHVSLGVPNIWYRAELHYKDVHLAGFTLPGVPLIISGSNRHIAWGFTASGADVSDLILLDANSQDPSQYQTSWGSRRFGKRTEIIHIRGAADESLIVRTTEWGSVLPKPLLGKLVAVRWTALDPQATNLDYMYLDQVLTVQDAIPLLNRAGGPPLHVLIADVQGNIGWTMTGRIPIRFGMDGLYSYSSADSDHEWKGYITPEALPRAVNPSSGFLVSANQRMVGPDYPYTIGYHDSRGYRAYRITERLQQMREITERDLFALQLDTHTDFYRYYQNLALQVLGDTKANVTQPDMTILRRHLRAWDGRAELSSLGLGILVEFREALMETVLSPLFVRCHELDPEFKYSWYYPDVPLQRLLDAKLPELLPSQHNYPNWDVFIRAILVRSAKNLMERYDVNSLDELSWGRISEAHITHPLSAVAPLLGYLLDMPRDPLPGCDECVRSESASDRLVVSPGRDEKGILHMPTGQSGHPLSPHYSDQHLSWIQGLATPLWTRSTQHQTTFEPKSSSEKSMSEEDL